MSKHPEANLLSSVRSAYPLHTGIDGKPGFCGHWLHGTAGMRRGVSTDMTAHWACRCQTAISTARITIFRSCR